MNQRLGDNGDLRRKTERQLVEIIRGDDKNDRARAAIIIHQQYDPILLGFIMKRLSCSLEDAQPIAHEVWVGFYQRVELQGLKTGIAELLFGKQGIARRRVFDVYRQKRIREPSIENDTPALKHHVNPAALQESLEDLIIQSESRREEQAFFQQIINSQLSDCERVIWILTKRIGCEPEIVARLMGRKRQTIYSAMHNAMEALKEYACSEQYGFDRDVWMGGANVELETGQPTTLIERFAEPCVPHLTSEELAPLGLSWEEFSNHYVCSLILPALGSKEDVLLLLTRREPFEFMQVAARAFFTGHDTDRRRFIRRLRNNRDFANVLDLCGEEIYSYYNFMAPLEFLFRIHARREGIRLIPVGPVEIHPCKEEDLKKYNIERTSTWAMHHTVGHSATLRYPTPAIYTQSWEYSNPTLLEGYMTEYAVDRTALFPLWPMSWLETTLPTKAGTLLDTADQGPRLPNFFGLYPLI
jgi:DNA-directed RNA polymerase specialized sigma24 family protein